MPKINIDDLCEPIEITVGGKDYTVKDISRELAKKMEEVGEKAQKEGGNVEVLIDIMTEILGANRADIAKLGMRKLLLLVSHVMNTVNDEISGKNVQKAAPMK